MNVSLSLCSRAVLASAVLTGAAIAQFPARYSVTLPGGFDYSRVTLARHPGVNADAVPEILVGLPDIDTVLILNGRNGNEISRITIPLSAAGFALATVPSLDGDASDEIVIGDPESGIVRVWSPRSNGTNVQLASWTPLAALGQSSLYGASLAAQDLDDDGRAELVIGAPGADAVEIVRLDPVTYAPSLVTLLTGQPGEYFGTAVATFGDQNNDGIAEIAVGSPRRIGTPASGLPGRVRVYSGAATVNFPLVTLDGATADDQFGWALANMGDQDGDGRDDLAIGAPSEIAIADSLVAIRGFTMTAGFSLQAHGVFTFRGTASESVGEGIAAGEDYDGNGVKDMLIGTLGDPSAAYPRIGFVAIEPTAFYLAAFASGATKRFGESVMSLGTVLGRRIAVVADPEQGKIYVF